MKKKFNQFANFNIQNHQFQYTKILLLLNEQDCTPNHGKINIQIYKLNLLTWD
jgi:hypothetical protein